MLQATIPMVIDGITIPAMNPDTLRQMREGGLTATVYMTSIWDGAEQALHKFADLKALLSNSSNAVLVRKISDIDEARRGGKTGIILGWQNADALGENLNNAAVFHELGLRMLSPCFNVANSCGSGCYEPFDGGLTQFGHEVVGRCNELGITLDLTHSGDKTGDDIIETSREPVCFTHAGARALMGDARNKTDEQMRKVAHKGGVIGVSSLPNFLPSGPGSDLQDYVSAVRYIFNVVGEDHIALGTDMTPGQTREFYEFTSRRKGHGTSQIDYTNLPILNGLNQFSHLARLVDALSKVLRGSQIEKFLGTNWLRLYGNTWAP